MYILELFGTALKGLAIGAMVFLILVAILWLLAIGVLYLTGG